MNFESTANKFDALLIDYGVPFTRKPLRDGFQWTFSEWDGDVVVNSYSYGALNGLVESYHMPWDNGDVTATTPEEMAALLAREKTEPSYRYEYTFGETLASLLQSM